MLYRGLQTKVYFFVCNNIYVALQKLTIKTILMLFYNNDTKKAILKCNAAYGLHIYQETENKKCIVISWF